MSTTAAVVLAIVVAALLVAAWSKPTRTAVGGIFTRDKNGRLVLVLSPAKKKCGKGKGKRKR